MRLNIFSRRPTMGIFRLSQFSASVLLLSGTLLTALPPSPLWANEMQQLLTVTGQASESVPTTLTEAQLTVEVQADTANQVQTAIAERSNRLVEYLRSQRVDKLQTQGLQLQPNYVYSNNERRLEGYIGSNTVSFQYPSDQVGKILDEAVRAGASRIDGIRFIATPETLKAAEQKALVAATADAQTQARVVLSSLNLTPQNIVRIVINPSPGQPMPLFRGALAASPVAGSAPTPIISGDQTVQATVTLEIAY
ncbi:SIMPL domain-containing protein [Synechocystis salina LEGE 00031]|uniref:SIMPL domain-containing protein n=2 Tax=Synechocystis TaxID=1142 RepID=A0ABR9VU27_9SYNC|nr:SIMPL domain-containing protein [Synechocystis salina LEGE 00041]MBE9254863.1 SIMPL domain-containing protein [Synechocystis salina LEGE 00031]